MIEVPDRSRSEPRPLGEAVLLENRTIWNGGKPVGRLRAAHVTAAFSLAPPCYTERVMPDLLARVARLARGDEDVVVIHAEGQGSIIAAALVLQLDPDQRRHIRLLTLRSPLWLYSLWFLAYFAPVALRRIGELLPAGRPSRRRPSGPLAVAQPVQFCRPHRWPHLSPYDSYDDRVSAVDWHVRDYAGVPYKDPAVVAALLLLEEDWKRRADSYLLLKKSRLR
jgi:hypothetical protein